MVVQLLWVGHRSVALRHAQLDSQATNGFFIGLPVHIFSHFLQKERERLQKVAENMNRQANKEPISGLGV